VPQPFAETCTCAPPGGQAVIASASGAATGCGTLHAPAAFRPL